MLILEEIKRFAQDPLWKDRNAVISNDKTLTYEQLDNYSDRLSFYLEEKLSGDKSPIVVYGHKSTYMLVAFLACVKSGRAYVPVDISVPLPRVEQIINSVNPPVILALEELDINNSNILKCSEIENIVKLSSGGIDPQCYLKPEDVYYIIFTSGSTGMPKGVQITYSCLNNFIQWGLTLGGTDKRGKVFLNQAPFSFDLSVMDLYLSLASGGTLFTLDKSTQSDYATLFSKLSQSSLNVWVSTPSFADICLSDRKFSEEMLKDMELFLFCGETLNNSTVNKLQQRFPKAKVVNTYGPTESTVAVTEIVISEHMNNTVSPLPVGRVKPGSWLRILKEDGTFAKEGEKGEIIIIGDTVSIGYYNNEAQTEKVFYKEIIEGTEYREYRIGDEGYILEELLYYCGRIDLQIKLHGYRIEIEDIESNILKLPGIESAVVVPSYRQEKISSLTAFLVSNISMDNTKDKAKEYRMKLKELIPEYMVPKKLVFIDKLPMTTNGKVDRKYLGGLVK